VSGRDAAKTIFFRRPVSRGDFISADTMHIA